MLAKIKEVKKARNDQGVCTKCKTPLPVGSPYRYYRPGFRTRTKVCLCMKAECTPRRSELETTRMADVYSAIEDAETTINEAGSVQDIRDALEECAESIRGTADEYEQSIFDAPMLEDQLRDRIEELNSFADDLDTNSFDDEPDEPDSSEKEEHEEWVEQCEKIVDDYRDYALDTLSAL